jgi:hypothetical protein
VGKSVVDSIDFATDPLGYIAEQMQAAAAGLSQAVLPALEQLTHPDLTAEWFLASYKVSFALAMFVFVGFLGWNFVLLARHQVSMDDVIETLTLYTPMFLGGVIFGPAIGAGLLSLTGAITNSLISWGVTGSVDVTTKALQDAIAAGSPGEIVGGSFVAIIFFFCLIVALLLSFVVLLVMLVTLYLTGAIIPLSLVWLVHPRQRAKGRQVVMVWVGICFSHVLLFLLLGVAFRMVTGLSTNFDDPGLTILANLAVAIIALLMATLSPLALTKFAPVGPSSSSGGGPNLPAPNRSGSRSGGGYEESDSDSQTAQMGRDDSSDAVAGGNDGSSDSSSGGTGGLMGRLAAEQAAKSSGSSSMEPTVGDSAEAASGADSTSGGGESDLTTAGTDAGDGVAAMSSGADTANKVGGGLNAAGTAAEATGAGAPVGLALQAVGTATLVAASAVGATAEMAQSAGDMATEHMEHGEGSE